MANPVNESIISWNADAATADSNNPTAAGNAGVGQAQELMGNLRLLKSEIRSESLTKSWERWLGLKNIAATGNIAFSFVAATQFSVNDDFTNVNRLVAVVGRRVRAFITGSVLYGRISAVVFGSPITTITVVWDSGSLDGTLTEVQFGTEPRALAAHKSAHVSGGSDPFEATDVLEAAAKRVQTSSGPTILAVAAITDGQWLKRSGATLVGFTVDNTDNAFGNRFVTDTEPGPSDGVDGDVWYIHD